MSKKNAFISVIAGTVLLIAAVTVFNSCSGGNSGRGTSTGTVALYATDNMSNYKQVIVTINKVTVLNTGSTATCDVLTTMTTPSTPLKINIANLSNVLQLLSVAECPAVPYNRLHIEFDETVDLMNSATTSTCSFTSYKDEANHVNRLYCNGESCSLDINGAVNVLVNQYNKVALDFRLKDFDIDNFGTPSCSVTMKVSPIHGKEFEHLYRQEAITGLVTNLTASTDTFTLSKHHHSFTVLYSGITASQQPALDDLLLRAQLDGLRTQVTTSTIDYANKTIEASKIYVKVEGLVSSLTTTNLTLTYKKGKTMTVDFSKAVVKGSLANDAWVEVQLSGYDSTTTNFLASRVEVEYECTEPYDHKKEMNTED
jgi:hypothetical protein